MKKRLIDLSIGLAIGIVLFLLIQPKKVDFIDISKNKEKVYKHKIDSLAFIITDLQKRDTLWAHTVYMLRIEKSRASQASDFYRKKYENLKNTPVPHLSDDEINRAVEELYPR